MINQKIRPMAVLIAIVSLIAGLATSSCGLGTSGGFVPTGRLAGPLADIDELAGVRIAVGSKNYTEQITIGKIAVILLQSAGANVVDLTDIPGSSSARFAMLDGQIDFQWEYTGTAWIAYLGHADPIADSQEQYEAVRDEDLAQNQLVWMEPAPMNNTYGFAARSDVAERLGITKLSQLPDLDPKDISFCVESEFRNRNDGFEPMLQTYGLELNKDISVDQIKTLDIGAIYSATESGLCTFGEVFTTDGRIKALDLVVIEDDADFFPKYNVCPVFGQEIYEANPRLHDLFEPVAEQMTQEEMIKLNARVDVDGVSSVDAAWEWLIEQGFIEPKD